MKTTTEKPKAENDYSPTSCSAPRGRVEGDWWLTPISSCCGSLMIWQSEDDIALTEEWHGNPNDSEPDSLACMKCLELCWQNATNKQRRDES
jgi:hypothetical protein